MFTNQSPVNLHGRLVASAARSATTRSIGACLLTLGLTVPAVGQEAQEDTADTPDPDKAVLTIDEEIVVGASLTELPKHRIGSSVTVIDREEIERRNKVTVLELLRTVPGLEIAQTGGPGKTTSVFIRGGNASHTRVTIDGIRVNSNTSGGYDFSDLAVDNIERIEVIRGPQGLLYGSEAVSGAINIVSRRGEGPNRTWVVGSAGNHNFLGLGAGTSGGNESLDYSLTGSRRTTDAVSAADEAAGNREDDPWELLTFSGRLGGAFLQDGRFDLALRYIDSQTDVDGFTFGVGPTDDLNALQERTQLIGSVTLDKPLSEHWTQTLRIATTADELVGSDPDDVFSNFEIDSETTEVMTRADLSVASGDLISIGYSYESRKAENVGSFDESVDLQSFFAEGLWTLGEDVDVSLGLRNDDHSVFGDETTYRAAVSARLGEMFRLHGSVGSGFKAPTFNDLYFPGFGNTDLRPETSQGFDLGLELASADGDVVVDLTYFDTSFDDLILFTFPGGFVNVAEAESNGVELTFSWRMSNSTRLDLSHTYNETEDLETGLQLARRPENRSALSLFFDLLENFQGVATVVAVRDRIDSDGSDMDDYERVDLSLDYLVSERFRPFLRVENLFDAEYSEIPGYTTPGISIALGAQFDL